jgi:transcription antitermination protein NusB
VSIGSRREARERALALLYEADAKGCSIPDLLADLPVPPERYAAEVASGVDQHLVELDGFLVRYARDWTVDRMPVIDRTLLRMAVFELLHRPDVPTGAIIDEAVELAKTYSTDDSGKFVNGMLSRIAEEARPSE